MFIFDQIDKIKSYFFKPTVFFKDFFQIYKKDNLTACINLVLVWAFRNIGFITFVVTLEIVILNVSNGILALLLFFPLSIFFSEFRNTLFKEKHVMEMTTEKIIFSLILFFVCFYDLPHATFGFILLQGFSIAYLMQGYVDQLDAKTIYSAFHRLKKEKHHFTHDFGKSLDEDDIVYLLHFYQLVKFENSTIDKWTDELLEKSLIEQEDADYIKETDDELEKRVRFTFLLSYYDGRSELFVN